VPGHEVALSFVNAAWVGTGLCRSKIAIDKTWGPGSRSSEWVCDLGTGHGIVRDRAEIVLWGRNCLSIACRDGSTDDCPERVTLTAFRHHAVGRDPRKPGMAQVEFDQPRLVISPQ